MESLAVMAALIFCTVLLSGPLSVLADHFNKPLMAALLATIAIWSGVFWFVHVSTSVKYVGLFSVIAGLYVVWRNARRN